MNVVVDLRVSREAKISGADNADICDQLLSLSPSRRVQG